MSRSPQYHGEKLLDNVYGVERTLNEGLNRAEEFDSVRRKHRDRRFSFLHPEVLHSEIKLAVYLPRLAVDGLSRVVKGVYHQRKYARVAEVDFFDATADALDRLEEAQGKDEQSDAA